MVVLVNGLHGVSVPGLVDPESSSGTVSVTIQSQKGMEQLTVLVPSRWSESANLETALVSIRYYIAVTGIYALLAI